MRLAFFAVVAAFGAHAFADETHLGLFMNGSKIGTLAYSTDDAQLNGVATKKSISKTRMSVALEGQPVSISVDSTTWTNLAGKPILMRYYMESGGKWSRSEARFGPKTVTVDSNNQNHKSTKKLTIPKGIVVDDPISLVLAGHMAMGASKSFYAFDPSTGQFQKNSVHLVGTKQIDNAGTKVKATLIEIKDVLRSTTTKVYVSSKGDALRIEAPLGIVMMPEPKVTDDGTTTRPVEIPENKPPSIDIANLTKLVPNKIIPDPINLSTLKVRFSGRDLSSIPNDGHQTLTADGKNWIVSVHPTAFATGRTFSILNAAKDEPTWVEPAMYIPSDNPRFIRLARQIVGTRTTVRSAASMIRRYVYELMKPNAGMGILRDANDVLDSKEGVCRDYAILTVTLLRAAGMPARLASGLVSLDGEFYYHAWAEAWDGAKWIGVDSTTDRDQISAAHIKLADGNVDTAFTFLLLDHVKMEILESSKK